MLIRKEIDTNTSPRKIEYKILFFADEIDKVIEELEKEKEVK